MKYLGAFLIFVATLHALLLASVAYWFVFADAAPPFVQGRPLEDAVLTLLAVGVAIGGLGSILFWCEP